MALLIEAVANTALKRLELVAASCLFKIASTTACWAMASPGFGFCVPLPLKKSI